MNLSAILKSLSGRVTFLEPVESELRRTRSVQEGALPLARKIFLEDELATPLHGFPMLLSSRLIALEGALEEYLHVEERAQMATAAKRSFDRDEYAESWRQYSRLLGKAMEYTVLSSYGRSYPNVFWLRHAAVVARILQGSPKRLAKIDSTLAREQGDRLKYAVFFRYLDRVLTLVYSQIRQLSQQVGEPESELFPGILTIMRDNVLLFTEVRVSADLSELGSYLKGHLGIDGRDFRGRLARLRDWHHQEFESNPKMVSVVESLLGNVAIAEPDRLVHRIGYVRFLTGLDGYNPDQLLSSEQVDIWDRMLPKLKEFELVQAFQGLVLPVSREGSRLSVTDPRTRGTGVPARTIYLSVTTRPLDFMTPWVLDPEVGRLGLVYDISQFSQTLSAMDRTSQIDQERSFQMIFRFQRRINQMAFIRGLRLEKYLGDGALYSGINQPHKLVIVSILIQRFYRDAVAAGFPFDRGLRAALNFGQYRMLPIQSSQPGETERYEFFGHGIVELTRLITGKTVRETDEIKKLMVGLGYPPENVDKFFAPLERRSLEVVERGKEGRRFHAYVNANGTLINEGIVATEQFVEQLGKEGTIVRLALAPEPSRHFVVVTVMDGVDEILAGFCKLGSAEFKGIGPVQIYEVVDGGAWEQDELEVLDHTDLVRATGETFMGQARRLDFSAKEGA